MLVFLLHIPGSISFSCLGMFSREDKASLDLAITHYDKLLYKLGSLKQEKSVLSVLEVQGYLMSVSGVQNQVSAGEFCMKVFRGVCLWLLTAFGDHWPLLDSYCVILFLLLWSKAFSSLPVVDSPLYILLRPLRY